MQVKKLIFRNFWTSFDGVLAIGLTDRRSPKVSPSMKLFQETFHSSPGRFLLAAIPLCMLDFLLAADDRATGPRHVGPLERYLTSAYFYKYLESLCRNDVLFRETLNSKQLEVSWSGGQQPGGSAHRLQLLSDSACFDFSFGPQENSAASWALQMTASERADPFSQQQGETRVMFLY